MIEIKALRRAQIIANDRRELFRDVRKACVLHTIAGERRRHRAADIDEEDDAFRRNSAVDAVAILCISEQLARPLLVASVREGINNLQECGSVRPREEKEASGARLVDWSSSSTLLSSDAGSCSLTLSDSLCVSTSVSSGRIESERALFLSLAYVYASRIETAWVQLIPRANTSISAKTAVLSSE